MNSYFSKYKLNYLVFFLIFFILLIFYCKTFNYPFIWDDLEMIVNNSFIKDWHNISNIFTHSAFGEEFSTQKFYRPIQILTYLFNYKIGGLNPVLFRFFNVVCFSFIGLFVFLISKFFSFTKTDSFLMTLLYCLHPVHVEIVTYVSGRGDVLYILFSLIAFYSFLKSKYDFSYYDCSVFIFTILAFLTKENSVIVPVLFIVYAYIFKTKNNNFTSYVLLFFGVLYSSYRLFYIKTSTALSWINHASFYEKLSTLAYSFVEYIKLFFFPYPLHMEYHHVESSFFNSYFFIALLIFLIMFFLTKYSDNLRLYYFGIGWFFICLIPVSHVFVGLSSTIRQHWASFAYLGLLFSVFTLLRPLILKNKILVRSVLVFCFFIFSFTVDHRNTFWSNAELLYKNDLKYAPQSFVLWNNLGYEKYKKNDYILAKKYFLKSIYSAPGYAYDVALNNLGVIYEMQGDKVLAEYYYKKSISVGDYKLAKQNLIRLKTIK